MTAVEASPDNGSETLCKRCHQESATYSIRSEQVCKNCFSQYVSTKTVKRMETYRVRGSTTKTSRKLLLPLSFGPSSASLLHILDYHIQTQYDRMNRAAYELFVVHIDLLLDLVDRKEASERFEKYKSRFPRHAYSSHGLEDALLLDGIDWKALGIEVPIIANRKPGIEELQQVLGSMSSSTSRSDIASTLLTRILVDVAKRNDCDAILFGDSTTRLAERALTETAKGRGFSLTWQVCDGPSPYGVGFNYPLRDLLKKEIVIFSSITTPPLTDLVIYQQSSSSLSASSKSTTIDDLMAQYFESVEENYPSIVANVVRTSSKLQPVPNDETVACGLCGLPIADGTDGIYGWGGDQNSDKKPTEDAHYGVLCYGCSRSING